MNRRKLKGMWGYQKELYDKYVNIIFTHPRGLAFSKNFNVRFLRLAECLTDYDYNLIMDEYNTAVIHDDEQIKFMYKGIIDAIQLIRTDKSKWSGSK